MRQVIMKPTFNFESVGKVYARAELRKSTK